MNFEKIYPGKEFDKITKDIETIYKYYGLLEKDEFFNEDPSLYLKLLNDSCVLGVVCVFDDKLPSNEVLLWKKVEEKKSIEIGRLAFFMNGEYDINQIMSFLVRELYQFCCNLYGEFTAIFSTHNIISKILIDCFGSKFLINIPCQVNWNLVKKGRESFYKKFEKGEAGLFQANLDILACN